MTNKVEFPPQRFFSMVLYGQRRCGKTVFMKYCLRLIRKKYARIFVFSQSEDVKAEFARMIGSKYCLDYPDALDIIDKVKQANRNGVIVMPTLLLFDDIILGNGAQHADGMFNNLAANARHYGISFIISSQYPKAIAPTTRDNLDYAVIFMPKSLASMNTLIEQYFGLYEKNIAKNYIMSQTKDYYCIIAQSTALGYQYISLRARM